MLEELLRYKKLGNKNELSFFLLNALALSENQKISDLRTYCVSNHYAIGQSIDGIIKLLEFMKLIRISGEIISATDEFFLIKKDNGDFDRSYFIKTLLVALRNEKAIDDFLPSDAIKLDETEKAFYIKESFIPLQYIGIRNVLISLGFFEHNPLLGSNILLINRACKDIFINEVINKIKEIKKKKRRKTLQSLKEQQAYQELAGKEAELFVLSFEQRRLRNHPLFDDIQRISEQYVNAGYDIESFNDKGSLFTDRFIEVKSYSENAVFYWSQNEIEAAKELTEKYFLYLVDRARMLEAGYTPKIFQNPYQSVFENDLWKKESQSWKFSLVE